MKKFLLMSLFFVPYMALAQNKIKDQFDNAIALIAKIIPVIVGLAVVYFLYGVAKFILASYSGSETDMTAGKQVMVWGIIALFVMLTMWGLVTVLNNTFDIGRGIPFILAP